MEGLSLEVYVRLSSHVEMFGIYSTREGISTVRAAEEPSEKASLLD